MIHTIKVARGRGFKKVKGLMFARKPYALVLYTRFGIHTFGVKFPIDVLILNNNLQIVSIKQNLKPNSIFFWNPRYFTVIELPERTIENEKMKRGDTIALTFV